MAYIRSISTRANLLTRRCHSSIGYVLHHHDDTKPDSIHKETTNSFQHRPFVTTGFPNSSLIDRRCFDFSGSFSRHMSSSIGEGTDTIEMMSDVAEVLPDSTLQYNATPFTLTMRLFIQFPVFICFFLALSNMAEKVPSFKSGGAFWFLDLSTPDALYVFPLLTALTFWVIGEVKMQEVKVNAFASITKKAIFCYWITSHVFHFAFSLGLRLPRVKKLLGLPEISHGIRSQVKESKEKR